MKLAHWAPLVVVIAALLVSGLLAAGASFAYKHPGAPEVKFVLSRRGAVTLAPGQKIPGAVVPDAFNPPRATIDETSFDFGCMNPHSIGEHVFVIRNAGTGVLVLRDGGTTCKCTVAEISRKQVPPGESAEVTLEWNTGTDSTYAHGATIRTNDPARPTIQLAIKGRVETVCEIAPTAVAFANLQPGETGRATLVCTSRRWSAMEVVAVESSLPELKCTVEPLECAAAAEADARSGARVMLELPPESAVGDIRGVVTVYVRPAESADQPLALQVDVGGNRLGRHAIIGHGIDGSGLVKLGIVPRGTEATRKFVLRIRNAAPPPADQIRVTTKPDFLVAKITPRGQVEANSGTYNLEIGVPADAPVCSYLGVEFGEVRVLSSGGDMTDIRLKVAFAVVEP